MVAAPSTPPSLTQPEPPVEFESWEDAWKQARTLRSQGLTFQAIATRLELNPSSLRSIASAQKWDHNIERERSHSERSPERVKEIGTSWYWERIADLMLISARMASTRVPLEPKALAAHLAAFDRHLDQGFRLFGLGEHAGKSSLVLCGNSDVQVKLADKSTTLASSESVTLTPETATLPTTSV